MLPMDILITLTTSLLSCKQRGKRELEQSPSHQIQTSHIGKHSVAQASRHIKGQGLSRAQSMCKPVHLLYQGDPQIFENEEILHQLSRFKIQVCPSNLLNMPSLTIPTQLRIELTEVVSQNIECNFIGMCEHHELTEIVTYPLKSFLVLEYGTYDTLTKIGNLGSYHAYNSLRYVYLLYHLRNSIPKKIVLINKQREENALYQVFDFTSTDPNLP